MLFNYSREGNTEKHFCFIYNSNHDTTHKYMVDKSGLEKEPDENSSYQLISDDAGHKKIVDILSGTFKIPTYQRGYRWDSQNVGKLLEDVYEEKLFEYISEEKVKSIKSTGNFNALKTHIAERNTDTDNWDIKGNYKYCIQPLVVMRKGRMNEYDVVDGQQRLTTIAIILSAIRFCKGLYNPYSYDDEGISIMYDSRPGSKELLNFLWNFKFEKKVEEILCLISNNEFKDYIWKEFQKENKFDKNIDFEHILNSFNVAVEFILQKVKSFRDVFGDNNVFHYCDYLYFVLINCTEVIWYIADKVGESQEDINERKIFANFNTGKLPLTNAELIKAIFMNPSNYGTKDNADTIKDRQIVISEKWDAIETELHNPDFWSFVPHPNQYDKNNVKRYDDTRIDVIFDFLVMRNWLKRNGSGDFKKDVNRYINMNKNAFLDKYYTFNEIEKWINYELQNSGASDRKREIMDKCWNEVRYIFSSLKEFYDDDGRNPETSSKLYNLIGFYIYANNTRKEDGTYYTSYKNNSFTNNVGDEVYLRVYGFLDELSAKSRKVRESYVKEEIRKLLGFNSSSTVKEYINSISYDKSNHSEIAILLLLYNIALLNKSGGIGNRFHFSEYAKQTWQREHIFAQDEEYLKNNNLIIERKAALNSLAKGYNNIDKKAGLNENNLIQYINFKYNRNLDFCPIEDMDRDGNNPLSVDEGRIKEFRKRYVSSTGYNKEYADAISVREQAKNLLDMYIWLEAAEKLMYEYNYYIINRSIRSKAELIDDILKYREDNIMFLRNIIINSLDLLDDKIQHFLKKEDDAYVFDIQRFNHIILEKLQIDLSSMRSNPFEEFKSYTHNADIAREEFKEWLDRIEEGEKDKKIDVINKIVRDRYIKKLKEILWFNIDSRDKLFDMYESGENFQNIKKYYLEFRNRAKSKKSNLDDEKEDGVLSLDNDELEDESEISVSNSNIEDENEIDTDSREELENVNDVEEIKNSFKIDDNDIDFIMIAIKSHIKTIPKGINEFFEKDYTKYLNDNSIGNMTLLSGSVNSSIGNKSYCEKCKDVYAAFKSGSFIPLGTIFVFTDLYTKGLNSATQWLPESRLKYLDDLVKTLDVFFDGGETHE
ncbi:GmrSD restriction endonuclease domain-containing protein [Clostridium butyricum]|uniref:GmrSD restriction endonuclease domain-containing protein n=1 Tax=Clostridium butyricum TaxID=1492 RepID=UPI00325BCF24